MSSKDLHNSIDERVALDIQTIAVDATTNGAIIDTAGFESVEFVLQTGTVTAGTVTPALQDGNDAALADAAAVAADDVLGAFVTLSASNGTTRVGYVGKKRYVRLDVVTAGGANLVTGAVAVLGSPRVAPVAQ